MTKPLPKDLANAIRALTIDAIEKSGSGHPGMPLGMADVATVLFSKFLKFDPRHPMWPDRDRFVLSAGHGSMLLYSLLYLTGYEDMTLDQIKRFRQLGSCTAGHPEYGHAGGIETSTGPLGQGLGNAVGMALAESALRARFGQEIVNHKTYTIVGDGCLMEGISSEAISFAGHLKLSNLIVLFDDNGITIDGSTSLATSENHLKRFEACNWNVREIDGHDMRAVEDALTWAQSSDKPVLIACKTVIGYGSPTKAGTANAHGSPLGAEDAKETKHRLGWTAAPFEIPAPILEEWRAVGRRCHKEYEEWVSRAKDKAFWEGQRAEVPKSISSALRRFSEEIAQTKPKVAARKSSEMVLEKIFPLFPELLGGSADLTGSNNTYIPSMKDISPLDMTGNYIHYGIREHAMGAIMNGIALHRGFVPYGGTFLVFSDYCRPSIRLSALMNQRVIYVMTHDSIGLGEDGPTHQPIEHLESLRVIPNLNVFRPADTIETAECWELALESVETPSILALSRQNLPTVRSASAENLCAKGGYVLKENPEAQLTFIATGSEVSLALETLDLLAKEGILCRVVSMPCTGLFDQQSSYYQESVLGKVPRISMEAGVTVGWRKYVGDEGLSIGLSTFGMSAPGADVFAHFGFTPKAIVTHLKTKGLVKS
jgi:transketolase